MGDSATFLATWREEGSCQVLMIKDPELWESFYAERRADRAPAAKVCDTCPVRLKCLRDALERGEVWGVWGGCDEVDLRRALWTDTNGTERERLRFPRCPACRARSECLFVRASCPIDGSGETTEAVECGSCGFEWSAATSVAAMKQFWDTRPAAAEPVPIKRKTRVRVPRGRIPSGARNRAGRVVQLPAAPGSSTDAVRALVASSGPQGD